MSWTVPVKEVSLSDADVDAYLGRLRSGWLTMGPSTQDFEAVFADYLPIPHAVAVSSGSAALHLALLSIGVGPGDEVIVPAFSFVAAANAARHVGAKPVLCDSVGPLEPVIDGEAVARLTTRRTKAVIAQHPMGYAVALSELRAYCDRRSIRLIEDASGALGALLDDGASRAGTLGDLGTFSFRSTGDLPLGEGGMVVTGDELLAANVRKLRSHAMTSVTWDRHRGHAASYDVVDIGYNYRLDEPRAALGISRLERLETELELRRACVRNYRSRLRSIREVVVPWSDEEVGRSAHSAFAILLVDRTVRTLVRDALEAQGIQTIRYPALSELTEYHSYRGPRGFPHAESFADRHCVLPLSPNLRDDQIELVTEAVAAALSAG
jgi:dTDP-4-amino-4,6-dideoxygalactose transaminase